MKTLGLAWRHAAEAGLAAAAWIDGARSLLWAAGILGALVTARSMARPPVAVGFAVSAVGERERADGSWDGIDLLRGGAAAVERFQLTLTPDTDVRALLEAQSPDGSWERLYLGTLAGHRDYALPAPHAFFGVQGDARVRLTLSRVHAPPAEPRDAVAGEVEAGPPLPLSDGAPFRASRVRFSSDGAARLALHFHGR
jgi:hypothetical protein